MMVVISNQVKTICVTNRERGVCNTVMNGNSWAVTNDCDGATHNSVTCDVSLNSEAIILD